MKHFGKAFLVFGENHDIVRVVLDHTFKHSYFPLAYLVKSADAGNMRTSVKVQSMVNSERGLVFRIWTIHGFMP